MRLVLLLSFICNSLNCLYSQVNLTQGLVAKYDFSGNASDNSGNNHNGLLHNGVKLTSDRFGQLSSAYYFDGVDDYISVFDDGQFSTPQFSVSIWFQTESNDLQNLIGKRKFEDDGTQGGGAQYQLSINYAPFPGIVSNLVGNNSSCSFVSNSSYINTVDKICNTNWYFVVVTFDGHNHKIYINGVLKKNVPTAFNSFLICNSELRFGNWWSGGTLPFKGKLDDIRWYNRPLNQDEVTSLYGNFNGGISNTAEFTFSQNVCNPYQVSFINNTSNSLTQTWDFGDGSTATSSNPIHTYSNYGNYNIKLVTNDNFGCIDSINKLVSLNLNIKKTIKLNDTTICKGSSLAINSDSGINYCWSGQGVNNSTSQITVTPIQNSIYFLNSKVIGKNLIINGDFTNGNNGFTSDYAYAATNSTVGQYFVGNNPKAWNVSTSNCVDHTGNKGNMLLINAASIPDVKIWCQTVNVLPNTSYEFSTWVQSIFHDNPAILKFSINGIQLGSVFNAQDTCSWILYNYTWNSGSNTIATICIENKNTQVQGNDFALDDISLAPVSLVRDSVKIYVVDPATVKALGKGSICSGDSIQLSASGTTYYSWSPQNDLSDPSIPNPVAKPVQSTTYVVTGYNVPGCASKDSVTINVNPKPVFSVTPNNIKICIGNPYTISASGADTYQWFNNQGNFLGNTSSISGIANQNDTLFAILHNNSCFITDTFATYLKVNAYPVVTIKKSNDVNCINPRAQLMATGGSTYLWTPADYISDPSVSNPYVYPLTDTWYHVIVTNNNCSTEDSILVQSSIQSKGGNFFVPSAFTPNHDGKNDCFGVKFWGFAESFEMWIYNRSGEVIFHTKNLSDCWDGTYKGELQPSGTYVYQIKASSICSNGPVYRKGLLTLIR